MRVTLTKEQRIHVLYTEDLYKVMQQILLRENKVGRHREHFWVVCLSGNYRIMLIELLGLGTEESCVLEPTEVYSFALQKQAKKIVMVHNHPPDRMLIPSPEDLDVTDRMYQVGKFLKVPLIDHLVINEKKFFSFEDAGTLERLKKSKKYVLKYQQEAEKLLEKGRKEGWIEGKKEGIEEGLEKGREEGAERKAIEMARALKKQGVDLTAIAVASGLSIQKIRKL
jgi:DNA repair protein RadC